MKLKDVFFASETNEYRPWILKPIALFSFCLVIWGLRLLLPTAFSFAAPGIDATDLMVRINEERTNRFVPALTTNTKLINAATAKSNDMLERSYFSHVDPDGKYVWPRIEAEGYKPYLTLGENLAMDFTSATVLIEAWMNSPTHRANVVNEKFQDQGLASTYGLFEPGHNTIIIVSLFGTLLKQTNPPPPPPAATPKPTQPPSPIPSPVPTPIPAPETAKPEIKINPDVKIVKKIIGDNQILELDIVISGNPSKVTATIENKKIELLPSAIGGQYLGVLTFPAQSDLSGKKLQITANDTTAQFDLKNLKDKTLSPEPIINQPASETSFINVLKIIFSIFASIYLIFLVIDSIIIHRTKIKRAGIHSGPHSLLFLLIVAINIISIWF